MIAVEGPDLAGKTTLCKRLVAELEKYVGPGRVEYEHTPAPRAGWDFFVDHLTQVRRWKVLDRFWQSEVVYRIALGERSRIDAEAARLVNAAHLALGGVRVVLCATTNAYDAILKDKFDDDHEAFSRSQLAKVNERFRRTVDCVGEPVSWDFKYVVGRGEAHWPAEHDGFVRDVVQRYAILQTRVASAIRNDGGLTT